LIWIKIRLVGLIYLHAMSHPERPLKMQGMSAPWMLLKLSSLGDGAWGIRLAGLALSVMSAWALWLGLAHQQAPWCVVEG